MKKLILSILLSVYFFVCCKINLDCCSAAANMPTEYVDFHAHLIKEEDIDSIVYEKEN